MITAKIEINTPSQSPTCRGRREHNRVVFEVGVTIKEKPNMA